MTASWIVNGLPITSLNSFMVSMGKTCVAGVVINRDSLQTTGSQASGCIGSLRRVSWKRRGVGYEKMNSSFWG
jgi:hypothetical protein